MKKLAIAASALSVVLSSASLCFATGGAAQGGGYVSILMLVGMLAIMYFLLIRPQKKQEKQTKEMRDSLKVGDEIVTIGGFMGKVVKVKDEALVIEIGPDKIKADVAKWSISRVLESTEKKAMKAETKEEPKEEPKKAAKPRRLEKAEEKKEETK